MNAQGTPYKAPAQSLYTEHTPENGDKGEDVRK